MSDVQEVINLLQIGLPIEVEIPTANSSFADIYFSQIMDVGDDSITVSLPQRHGVVAGGLVNGSEIYIRLALEDDATYLSLCQVKGWNKNPPALKVSFPYRVHRIQRRNFVRIDAQVPINLTFRDQVDTDEPPFTIHTYTTDLSGGGMLVFTNYGLPLYQEVELNLNITDLTDSATPGKEPDIVSAKGQICRCRQISEEEFQVGITITEIDEHERDRLIRYIFKYQRDSLKRKPHLMA